MASRKKSIKRTANPTYPNAGVEAWYRDRLQAIVREMARDMLRRVREAWNEGGGIATDGMIAGHEGPPTHDAAGVMFWHNDEVLLLHRTDGLGWALPGGGLEPGEDTYRAALRECTEEMGYVHNPATNGALVFHHTQHWRGVRFATYHCTLVERFTPLLNDEHDRFIWMRPGVAVRCLKLHPGVRDSLEPWAMDAKKPTTPLLLQRALEKWGGLWTRRIEKAAVNIATDFAKRAKKANDAAMMRQLVQAGFAIKFKPTKLMATAYDAVIAENVGLIRSIPQKFLTDVQNTVWQGVMGGSNMQHISENIQQKYGIAHRRAALIASDQNAKAKAAMERARRKEAGITHAIWQHSHAGVDPRPTHVDMDEQEYPVDEGMWDAAVKKYVWPGTEINCRCTDRPVIPGFA